MESGPSFEVMIIQYHILQIMNSRSGATSKPRAKFQGGCYLEDIPREAGARRRALWSPAYADPSSYHSPAVLREDNLFGVLISLSLNNVFSGTFEVSAVAKDYNDLIQTASSSSLRRQT